MNSRILINFFVFVGLVAVGAATRLVPHFSSYAFWNLNAVGAFALFAGFYFRNRSVAFAVPLLIMLIGDIVISGIWGRYDLRQMAIDYFAISLPVLFGPWLRAKLGVMRVGTGAVAAAVLFFIVSNAGYWAIFMPLNHMPRTPETLMKAYVDGLPFFRGTLIGNLVFSALAFGFYTLATKRLNVVENEPQADAASA